MTPALEAVRRLVARGHDVRVLSEACNRPESEAAGDRFRTWGRAPSREDRSPGSQTCRDWAAATPQEGLLGVIRDHWCGPALAYAEDVVEELRREPADLVVTCEALFGVMAGCESMGQPFATLCPNISLGPLPGVPPLGPGLPPARTDEERAMHAEIRGAILAMFDTGLPALTTPARRWASRRSSTSSTSSGPPRRSCSRRPGHSTSRPSGCRRGSASSGRSSATPTGSGLGRPPGQPRTTGRSSPSGSRRPSRTTPGCCRTSSTSSRPCRSARW